MSRFCAHCAKDEAYRNGGESCRIVANALAWNTEHPEYPAEWTYDADDQPTCTAFAAAEKRG